MSHLLKFASTGTRLLIIAAVPVMLIAATPALAQRASIVVAIQDGVGSANITFRRHFWRGQLNHGTSVPDGYAVHNPATGLYLDADG